MPTALTGSASNCAATLHGRRERQTSRATPATSDRDSHSSARCSCIKWFMKESHLQTLLENTLCNEHEWKQQYRPKPVDVTAGIYLALYRRRTAGWRPCLRRHDHHFATIAFQYAAAEWYC